MASQRLNALRVLPVGLFMAISKAFGGEAADLYIPSIRRLRRDKRDQLIVEMAAAGHTAADIANEFFVHPATVWRVLAKAKTAGVADTRPEASAAKGGGDDVQG